ncbi:DUF2306 domain-containing protein [Haliea sp. AH-315-K21]|uniref:DUF2306 domain-containing protein n=1 Tax=SAR86 cluster bacterium TaxID=2030880 RepID=A0A2A5CBI5_9GAMM|nr:DUF2306 domain-containing protein [Haliea sp. AH-315-K21]PCJ41209.1 MAG: hypothetical protein COA71_09230 [SAR86 cluster bacterium]
MENMTIIGWLHTIACVLAMITGGVALFAIKGSVDHKKWGRWFFYTMLVTNVSALLIYPEGQFNVFHWMAIGTLVVLLLGWYAAPRQRSVGWANMHLSCMLWSYYMLWGGLVNEAFLRVPVLKQFSPFFGADGAVFGMIQMVVMLVFIVLWLKFLIRTTRRFKQRSVV